MFLFGKPSFSETWTHTLHFIVLKNTIQAYKLPMSFSFDNWEILKGRDKCLFGVGVSPVSGTISAMKKGLNK